MVKHDKRFDYTINTLKTMGSNVNITCSKADEIHNELKEFITIFKSSINERSDKNKISSVISNPTEREYTRNVSNVSNRMDTRDLLITQITQLNDAIDTKKFLDLKWLF